MGFYPIELTSADVVAQQEVLHLEFASLINCRQFAILPPFPDYSLLSHTRAPKALLKVINEVVLGRRSIYDEELGWLLLPLILDEKIIGVLFAEEVDQRWTNPTDHRLLERVAHLCLERLQWEKRGCRDAETMLWRREALIRELNRAIDEAETGGSMAPRRLLGEGAGQMHFTVICFVVDPAPEPWAGAGPLWSLLGPKVVESLPNSAMAAHLGGGCLGVFWPRATAADVQTMTTEMLGTLRNSDKRLQANGENWNLVAGIATFPEDFYDEGPFLPWEKSGVGGRLTAAEEVIRRAILAAETARKTEEVDALTYNSLRERGLVPRPESAIEKRLSTFLARDGEDCALLMLQVDDWKVWQQQQGPKEAARGANGILEVCKEVCPEDSVLDWIGPDRLALFLPGADGDRAEELGRTIRRRVRSGLDTTVSIGLSVHPCPGFTKRDILDNARKALVHTGFFGPDTQTLFDAVSLNINGDRLYESGRLQEAVEEFQKALALDPENVNVRNSLGICHAQNGSLEEAVAEFSRAAELTPDDFMPQYNRGCALLGLGYEAEAERAFDQAAGLEPDDGGVCFQLAKLYMQQDRLEEAVVHLIRALEIQPIWGQAWRLLGESHLRLGAMSEAMNSFKQALKVNGEDAASLSGLAIAYGRTDTNLDIALSLSHRSVELEPENVIFVRRLAELLLQNQELQEAAAQCERAMALAPADDQVRRLQDKIAAVQKTSA